MRDKVQGLINGNAVLVMGTSTCPFCIEVRVNIYCNLKLVSSLNYLYERLESRLAGGKAAEIICEVVRASGLPTTIAVGNER